jgi:starch synthase
MKKSINYISNLSLDKTSGGWGGINHKIYSELTKYFHINTIAPISPNSIVWEKAISKAFRTIGLRGKFHFFSERRLKKISSLINAKIAPSADYNFFFGATPWIDYHSERPYAVYLDAFFLTYMDVFSTPDRFISSDLKRIAEKEIQWLEKADHIFWGSDWAKNELFKYKKLKNPNMTTIWTGGYIDIPDKDRYQGELLFTFISLNFEKKGGKVCVQAFNKIKPQYPEAQLIILGQEPPQWVQNIPGISYGGYLRKTVPEEYKKFKSIIERSFFMIHPTKMDTMGAVIIESGYYGCPTIAPKRFGIPELIIDNETGLLVDVPFSVEDFVNPILTLIKNTSQYDQMRRSVREHTINNLSWQVLGEKISKKIALSS